MRHFGGMGAGWGHREALSDVGQSLPIRHLIDSDRDWAWTRRAWTRRAQTAAISGPKEQAVSSGGALAA